MAITTSNCFSDSLAGVNTTTKAVSPNSTIPVGASVLMVSQGAGVTVTAVSDSSGNTWTLDATGSDGTRTLQVFSAQITTEITTSGTITITRSASTSTSMDVFVQSVSGLATSTAFDKSSTGTWTSSTAATAGTTATLAQANEISFAMFRTTASPLTTFTPATGWSAVAAQVGGSGGMFQVVSSTAALSATATVSSTSGAGVQATYKGAGSSAPVNTVAPVVSGTTQVGSALSTTNGTWTDDGSPTFSYQWQRDNQGGGSYSNIGSATSSSYTLVDADDGCNIRCVVTDSTPDGNTSANSNSVGLVTEPVPTNSVAPSVSGSATVGSVLSTTNGTWTHMGGTVATFAYQWTRAGVNISSATSSTYTTVSADTGHAIGCTVTATNDGGSGTPTASSNTITVTSGGGGGASQDFGALIAAHVI